MLHIQTRIVDIHPEKENVITTRLLLQPDEIGCFDGKDGSLSALKKTGVDLHILPREELPMCISRTEEILQVCQLNSQLMGSFIPAQCPIIPAI